MLYNYRTVFSKAWFTRVKQAQHPPVHTREIVKQARAQEQEKLKNFLFLMLALAQAQTCEPGFSSRYVLSLYRNAFCIESI